MASMLTEALAEWRLELHRSHEERARALGMTVEEFEAYEREQTRLAELAEERRAFLAAWDGLEPPDVLEAIFDGGEPLRQTIAVMAVDRWLLGRRPALVLCGAVGTGKTVASLYAIRRRGQGALIRAADLPERVSPRWDERRLGIQPLELGGVLIAVEDLGAERPDDRFAEALFRLVDSRQSPRRRTLITTNLTPGQLAERYDARVIDRLRAMAAFVELGGESLRHQRPNPHKDDR